MTITKQSVASVARQVLAIAGIVMGVLTASVTSLHLPVSISAILTIAGSVILGIEHYVGDPSTGTLTTQTPAGPAPVAPVAIVTAVVPQTVPTLQPPHVAS